jgi:hypothetical protein
MGGMLIEKLGSPWELSVVENAGEVPASEVQDEFVIKTDNFLIDIKAQLMLMPRALTYTAGWRAIVWKNKETGRFQDLTEEEYQSYIDGGIVTYTRANGSSAEQVEGTSGS